MPGELWPATCGLRTEMLCNRPLEFCLHHFHSRPLQRALWWGRISPRVSCCAVTTGGGVGATRAQGPPLAEPPPTAGVSMGGGPRTNQQVLPPKSAASTPSPQDLKPLAGLTSRISTQPLCPRALRVRLKS